MKFNSFNYDLIVVVVLLFTCYQNRQSIKFQNHENINFVETELYFFISYNQVYIAKHFVKSLHSGFILGEIQVITKLKDK